MLLILSPQIQRPLSGAAAQSQKALLINKILIDKVGAVANANAT